MSDIVAVIILIAIVGAAVAYIVRQKRQGVKCIGCAVGKEACAHAAAAQGAGAQGTAVPGAAGSHSCGCGCGSVDSMVARMNEAAGCCCEGEKHQR